MHFENRIWPNNDSHPPECLFCVYDLCTATPCASVSSARKSHPVRYPRTARGILPGFPASMPKLKRTRHEIQRSQQPPGTFETREKLDGSAWTLSTIYWQGNYDPICHRSLFARIKDLWSLSSTMIRGTASSSKMTVDFVCQNWLTGPREVATTKREHW
jgi:hypothetical protein